ncbi:MAG TPA: acyltransferase family protein [Croceibacterium sp.]
MTDQTAAAASERLHALDLVRAAALLLGIVFHAALPFMADYDLWLALDQERSRPVTWLAFTLHTFRMTTFFLLAGYFGRLLLVRRGTRGFVSDRARRILLPLLIFWLPVMILYVLALILAASLGATPVTDEPAPPPEFTLTGFPLTHLWFLYVLVLLYAAALILRTLVAAIDRTETMRKAADRALEVALRVPFALPLLLTVAVAALLLGQPAWAEWWGIPTPDRGFLPNRAALGGFGLAFGLGWLVHRSKLGFMPLSRLWAPYLIAALALTVSCLWLIGPPMFEPQLAGQERLIFAGLYAAAAWCWTLGLVGAALRFIRHESPVIRYLADSSYWLYIVHLPLLVALEALVAHWPVPAELKLLLIVAVASGLMLVSYHYLVRATFIGTLLNGRRYPRKGGTA